MPDSRAGDAENAAAARNAGKGQPPAAEIPHQDLTYAIIGCAMRVHDRLGPGLKEAFYQRALSTEMTRAGLSFEEERAFRLTVDDAQVGMLYLDHLVEGVVVVEEKAFPHLLTREDVAQVITYLAVSGAPVGVLVNFGRRRLEFRRILPPLNISDWSAKAIRYAWRPTHQLVRFSSADSFEVC